MVGLVDVADGERGDARLVADAVGERRLKHAAVDGLRPRRGLSGGDVDQVGAVLDEHARDLDRVLRLHAVRPDPVMRRDAHRHRPLVRPHLAYRTQDFEREAHAVLERAAILVGAPVGERRDERRHQVAVRVVQFQPVEADARGALGRTYELVADRVHIGARELAWHLVLRRPRHGGGADDLPIVGCERRVRFLPAELGRAFWSRMAELDRDLRVGLGMDEIDEPLPGALVLVGVEAGAAGRDAPLRRNAGHFGEDEAGAALGALGVMHEVPIVRRAVLGLVLRHRRDADAVLQLQPAHAQRHEHGRPHRLRLDAGRALVEPFLRVRQPLRIALAQILVADALRAREQRIAELHRVEVEIALDVLEPLGRIARRILQAQHFEPPLALVAREGLLQRRLRADVIGERDGAFHGELRARADGKMRGRGGIAEQHDVLVAPALAQDAVEVEPGRAAQVARVRHQRIAAEIFGEDALAGGDRLVERHAVEAGLAPGFLRALDDERRGVGVELVGVHPDPAVLGLLEDEGERLVEFLVRAEPDVLAGAHVDVGLEHVGMRGARLRVHAVGGDDEIVMRGIGVDGLGLGLELDRHAQFAGATLENPEEPLASDAAEAVAAGDLHRAAVVDGDVVPVGEVVADRLRADRIVAGQILERLVGQHDAPAERVVRLVALDDGDLVRRITRLQRDREIEAPRPASENCCPHEVSTPLPWRPACQIGGTITNINILSLKYMSWRGSRLL